MQRFLPDKEALISQVRACKLGADLAVHLPVADHIGLVLIDPLNSFYFSRTRVITVYQFWVNPCTCVFG